MYQSLNKYLDPISANPLAQVQQNAMQTLDPNRILQQAVAAPLQTPDLGFGVLGGAAAGAGGDAASWMPEWMKGMIGTKDQPGWGGMALGTASALGNAFMGMQQYGLAKKTLAENQRQFQANYDAQRQTTNTALEDRQRARVAANPGAYQSVGDYMRENGVK